MIRSRHDEVGNQVVGMIYSMFPDAEDHSEVVWGQIDKALYLTLGNANKLWQVMCKRYCNLSDDFNTKKEKIISALNVDLFT